MDIIIFGISGNLAERKLIPAIESLYRAGKIPEDTRVIGYSRSPKEFSLSFEYLHVVGSYSDIESFRRLKAVLRPGKKHLFYLALPP
jgi:glucose-6-phosphate 1-dehydrogenase